MRPNQFKVKLLLRNAAAYALFACVPALVALAAYSQQASPPETHGIVVANMDLSIRLGDDFYHYANRDWIKRTEIPPDSGGVDVAGWNELIAFRA